MVSLKTLAKSSAIALPVAGFLWLTHPALLTAMFYLVMTVYHAVFSLPFYRSTVRNFPMTWELMPPGSVMETSGPIRATPKPIRLRFVENPKLGIIVNGSNLKAFETGSTGVVNVTIEASGDKRKGVRASNVVAIDGQPVVGADKGSFSHCSSIKDCGIDPVDAAICRGPCATPR